MKFNGSIYEQIEKPKSRRNALFKKFWPDKMLTIEDCMNSNKTERLMAVFEQIFDFYSFHTTRNSSRRIMAFNYFDYANEVLNKNYEDKEHPELA